VAVTWNILRTAGHTVQFATPDGQRAYTDPRMITGEGLDPWGWIPVLKKIRLIGLLLRAQSGARQAYRALEQDPNFLQPKRYEDLRAQDYDGLVLPGGHARGMRPYLENRSLQAFVANFFETVDATGQHKPIAAICHGVLLAARSISAKTGKSVLYSRKTTALTWKLERSAWMLSRWAGRWWDRDYYRTYREQPGEPAGYWSVQAEVTRALARVEDFYEVPAGAPQYLRKDSGLFRDTADDDRPAFVVRDGSYVSARWPGDVHTFALAFARVLAGTGKS
jgi:putative intracellular protease/amidase